MIFVVTSDPEEKKMKEKRKEYIFGPCLRADKAVEYDSDTNGYGFTWNSPKKFWKKD